MSFICNNCNKGDALIDPDTNMIFCEVCGHREEALYTNEVEEEEIIENEEET